MDTSLPLEHLLHQVTANEFTTDLANHGLAMTEAVEGVTGLVCDTYFQDQAVGQTAQGLADWNFMLKSLCSTRYRELQQTMPEASRAAINEVEDLAILNAVRRGVKHAMIQAQLDTGRYKRGQNMSHVSFLRIWETAASRQV